MFRNNCSYSKMGTKPNDLYMYKLKGVPKSLPNATDQQVTHLGPSKIAPVPVIVLLLLFFCFVKFSWMHFLYLKII